MIPQQMFINFKSSDSMCSIEDRLIISKVCPYCWFARCEIEGLVERWQLCNGDSEKWNEIISGFEYDTSSDDDEDDDDE